MTHRMMIAALLAAFAIVPVAHAADADGWNGPGWYYVMDTPGGGFLSGGPYATSDACTSVDRGMSATIMDKCTYFSAKPTPQDLGQTDDGQ